MLYSVICYVNISIGKVVNGTILSICNRADRINVFPTLAG